MESKILKNAMVTTRKLSNVTSVYTVSQSTLDGYSIQIECVSEECAQSLRNALNAATDIQVFRICDQGGRS